MQNPTSTRRRRHPGTVSHHQFVTRSDLVEVQDTGSMGRGVFAVKRIPAGTLLFSDPVMLIPEEECRKGSVLSTIVYFWSVVMEDGQGLNAISLGMGTLMNHSKTPNIVVYFDYEPERLDFYALQDIAPGDQLTHDYNYDDYPPDWTN